MSTQLELLILAFEAALYPTLLAAVVIPAKRLRSPAPGAGAARDLRVPARCG